MIPKTYCKHINLLQDCYNTRLQLPPSSIKKQNVLHENKDGYLKWNTCKCNLWQQAAKLITLILAAQVGIVQASGDNATVPRPRNSLTYESIGLYTPESAFEIFTPVDNELPFLTSQYSQDDDFQNTVYINKRQTSVSNGTRIGQELKQIILYRFDKINDDLQDIIKMFNAIKPTASSEALSALVLLPISLPFDQRQKCNVTEEALSELKNVLNNALSGITTTQTEVNCKPNAMNTNSCDEILKLIQCGVNHLKTGFIDATENIVSLDRYTKLSKELYDKFPEISDQINQQTSQKYKPQLDDCNKNMQELPKYLNITILQLKEEITSLCISEIGKGRIELAVKKFKELNAFADDQLIYNIIEKAYRDYGQLNNFDNIINFIEDLPWFSRMVVCYEALFESMEKNTPKILIFVMRVQKVKELHPSADENSFIARLDHLNSKTLEYVNNVINGWVYKIRKNDYEEILKFSQTYTDAANFNLDRVIEKIYNNDLRNAERIIEFTRNLTTINSSIVSLHSLFNQMKNHGNDLDSYELLMLAYYCKELMAMKSYHSVTKYYKDQLITIQDNLPDSVRKLIWNGSDCTMRNRVYNEYLYAGSDRYAHDAERRNVYTLRTGKVSNECHWKITPRDYAKFFSIQNTNYNDEYLYAVYDDAAYDSDRRRVYTWRTKTEAADWTYWRLVPVSNGEYFIIQSKAYHYEYLYPGYDKLVRDREARYVFTWRKTEETPTYEGHWDIKC